MEDNLATEMLKEISKSAKRWFVAFIIVIILLFVTIGLVLLTGLLPDEIMTLEQSADGESLNQVIGGDYSVSVSENHDNATHK